VQRVSLARSSTTLPSANTGASSSRASDETDYGSNRHGVTLQRIHEVYKTAVNFLEFLKNSSDPGREFLGVLNDNLAAFFFAGALPMDS
jgi:hypothetical protein